MRILLINEYLDYQGAEEIVKKQYNILSKKNDVYILSFKDGRKDKHRFYSNQYKIINISRAFKMLFSPFDYIRIRRYIKTINPSLIILHNIFSSPITVYQSLRGYKAIQIVHDYKIICPTSRCVKYHDKKVCTGYQSNNCIKECGNFKNRFKLLCQLTMVKKCTSLREKVVSLFISPSEALNQQLINYGFNSQVINNPIELPRNCNLQTHSKCMQELDLLYMGAINENKGIKEFLTILQESNIKFHIALYGKTANKFDLSMLNKDTRIEFKGVKKHNELMEIINNYDFLVVPSMCLDNYPTVVLEAMSKGVVVLGSNRGGIVELLAQSRGIIFKYGNRNSLIEALNRINNMSQEDYDSIRQKAFEYVLDNNNVEKYESKLTESIKTIMKNNSN